MDPQPSTFFRVGPSSSEYSTMSNVTPGTAHIQLCDTISLLPRNGQGNRRAKGEARLADDHVRN